MIEIWIGLFGIVHLWESPEDAWQKSLPEAYGSK